MAGLNFTVTKEQTAAFGKCWDSGGIKVIFDNTTLEFATAWANIVLKSFVYDMQEQVKKVAEAKLATKAPATEAVATQTVPAPSAPSKGRILLTD
jgi:hypothetical protein